MDVSISYHYQHPNLLYRYTKLLIIIVCSYETYYLARVSKIDDARLECMDTE